MAAHEASKHEKEGFKITIRGSTDGIDRHADGLDKHADGLEKHADGFEGPTDDSENPADGIKSHPDAVGTPFLPVGTRFDPVGKPFRAVGTVIDLVAPMKGIAVLAVSGRVPILHRVAVLLLGDFHDDAEAVLVFTGGGGSLTASARQQFEIVGSAFP
jgi:hypothetical protein